MSASLPGSYVRLSHKVIALIVDGLHDQAVSAIDQARKQISDEEGRRLAALVQIDRDKPKSIAQVNEARRRAYEENGTWIAYIHMLGFELVDIERWADAEIAFDEVIALSRARADFYFLDEARLLRALCLKYLGRRREMEMLRAEIPPDAGALICREDLGGCILLTRDHLS
jgi:uncharacterized protein HemY